MLCNTETLNVEVKLIMTRKNIKNRDWEIVFVLSYRDHRMCTNCSFVYALFFTELSIWFIRTSMSDRLHSGTFRKELVVAENVWRHNVKITSLQFNIYVINDTRCPDSSLWNIGIYGRPITPHTGCRNLLFAHADRM